MFPGKGREFAGNVRVDGEPVRLAAVRTMHARALLADQRTCKTQMTRDPRRARVHAAAGEHYHHARRLQARYRSGDRRIGQGCMPGPGRDQRAVDIQRNEACPG